MTRIRLIMYRYDNPVYGEVDIARQQPDGLKEFTNNHMFILTLKRGDTWRALKQMWWFLRRNPGPAHEVK